MEDSLAILVVILSQPELLRHLLVKWLRNEPFFEEV